MAARGGQHLHLEAAFARGQVDLRDELFRRDLDARRVQHRGESCRAALIFGLREEGHFPELDVLVQRWRQRIAQLRGLGREAGAATEK